MMEDRVVIEKFVIDSKKDDPFKPISLNEENKGPTVIEDVCDYLKIISKLKNKINEEMNKLEEIKCLMGRISKSSNRAYLWFRGENKGYKPILLPTAFRTDDESIFQKIFIEREMYKYVWLHKQQYDSNFQEYINFDVISTLRHYGLRARLLDFSTDPLVALFFSLEDTDNKDKKKDKKNKEDNKNKNDSHNKDNKNNSHNDTDDSSNNDNNSYVYITIPNLLNFQLSYLDYILFLSSPEDYNVKVRLKTFLYSEIILKMLKNDSPMEIHKDNLRELTKKLHFNSEIFVKTLEEFKNKFLKCIGNNRNFSEMIENIREKYLDKDTNTMYIPIEIYLTPIAVIFQYANRYMEHQKACGILYGEIYGKPKKDYSLINQLRSPYFLFNYIELPESISPLYRIRIPNDKKKDLKQELQKNFRLSKYEIFGKDLRFLEEKVKSELYNIIPINLE